MKSSFENRLSMYKVVIAVMDNQQALWTGFVPLSDLVTELKNRYGLIVASSILHDQSTGGITEDKGELREILVDHALDVALKLKVFGKITNLPQLSSEFDVSRSELLRLRDTDLVTASINIHGTAVAYLANLGAYNVTTLQLSGLQLDIDRFEAAIPLPLLKINEKMNAGEELEGHFERCAEVLDLMDGLMIHYKQVQLSFYQAYKSARKIVDSGHRNTKLGLFVELEDGVDAVGTPVVIEKGTVRYSEEVELFSSQAMFESVLAGLYTVRVEKAGYKSYLGQVRVKTGRLNTESIVLMKE